MLGSILNVTFSCFVVVLVFTCSRWVQPKTSKIVFVALLYAWYATTGIWAATTKKLETRIEADKIDLFPSTSFWLTLLPQVMSFACMSLLMLCKRLTDGSGTSDSMTASQHWQTWCIAGMGFFFGQLFTVEGLGAGAPGLVFGVKVLEPLSTSLLAIPVLGQRCNCYLLAAIVVACAGIAVAVVGAHRSSHVPQSALGACKVILVSALANLGFSVRSCIVKNAYSQRALAPLEIFGRVNATATLAGTLMLVLWLLYLAAQPHSGASLAVILKELGSGPWDWFSTCLCYFLYQCSSILLLECLFVESHALLVALKHVFVVIVASVLSGSYLNTQMIIGVGVASAGVFFYAVSPAEEGAATALLPHQDKINDLLGGVPRALCFTVLALGSVGIVSPFLYM